MELTRLHCLKITSVTSIDYIVMLESVRRAIWALKVYAGMPPYHRVV